MTRKEMMDLTCEQLIEQAQIVSDLEEIRELRNVIDKRADSWIRGTMDLYNVSEKDARDALAEDGPPYGDAVMLLDFEIHQLGAEK